MRKYEDNELQKKYDTDESFRTKANHKQQQYLVLRKKAKEAKDDNSISQTFMQKFRSKDNRVMYFIYGYLQPQPGKHTAALTIKFINNFKPQIYQRFSVVYFNEHTPSSDYFKQFKNIFLLLPFSILEKMQAFVLVKPSFYLKAMNYLTIANAATKLFEKCYQCLDNCRQLCQKFNIPVQDFVSFVPEQYSTEFPEKFKRDVSLHNYRVNFYGQNLTESMRFQKFEFEKAITALIQKQVNLIENYEVGDIGIPVILQVLVFYFTSRPQGLCVQGIFRKSVAVDEQEQTFAQLSKRNYEYIETITNPHLIASLIKKFFYGLKEPVVPFHLFKELMDDQKVTDKKQHLKTIIGKLNKLNFTTLIFLIEFLKREVITRQSQNKMSANNIAVCFSPCLMKSEVSSMADLIYATKSVNYTALLINQFDYIFGTFQERSNLFKSNVNQQNNVFQKTIREELNFDSFDIDLAEEEELKAGFIIRPTQSYALKQDVTIQELYLKSTNIQESAINSSFNKQNQSFVRPTLSSRKLSDKIDELSNEIKQIQKSHSERKKSNQLICQRKNYNNSVVNIQMGSIEDQTTFVELELQDEEDILKQTPNSLTKSKMSLTYSNTVQLTEVKGSEEPTGKETKKKNILTWQQLSKE